MLTQDTPFDIHLLSIYLAISFIGGHSLILLSMQQWKWNIDFAQLPSSVSQWTTRAVDQLRTCTIGCETYEPMRRDELH